VKQDAEAIFSFGDLFDFWFEYKMVVPKGFVRVLENWPKFATAVSIYFLWQPRPLDARLF
jgi:UDP-2,3-diacylglucosamine hydrolase